MNRLVVVGCGPKAVALAAKVAALRSLGWQVPELVIIERQGIAANWDGSNGYTDGEQELGTPPQEDVGFPYGSTFGPDVDEAMLRYSYMAYRVAIGDYAEWLSRYLAQPTHGQLAQYFKWVAEISGATIIRGEVRSVTPNGGGWQVSYEGDRGPELLTAHGVVLTGPGEARTFPHIDVPDDLSARIRNGQDFWLDAERFERVADQRIGIIGGGETSAAITTHLTRIVGKGSLVEVITPHPMLFTRSAQWPETMYYYRATDWTTLSDAEKFEVIRHADRGTFSVGAREQLNSARNLAVRIGRVTGITAAPEGQLAVCADVRGQTEQLGPYDTLIEATGFDFGSVLGLVDGLDTGGLESRIANDLSVGDLPAKLHIPALASLTQGPGFPHLSCLGLVADRILGPYVARPGTAEQAS